MNEVPGAWEMGSDSDSASNWTCLKDVMTGRFQHGGFNIQGHFFHLVTNTTENGTNMDICK